MTSEISIFELNTGAQIPSVGWGIGRLSLVSSALPLRLPSRMDTAISIAVKCTKRKGGVVLKKLFEDGVVKREELFITSKLWCIDHAPEDVPPALDRTLQDLQLDC